MVPRSPLAVSRVIPSTRRRIALGRSPFRAVCAAIGLLWACLLAGCQVGVLAAESLPAMAAGADAEAGLYAGDPRWAALTAAWPQRAGAAFERLEVVTGLTFEDGMAPRLLLRPFGDERVPFEVRMEIVDGRRRAVIHVNAEPQLAGVRDIDRVLLRALCTAAFQDAARRHGAVTPWMERMAATAAAGDLDERLTALHRRLVNGATDAATVAADKPGAAEATGVAALVLLAERGQPDDIRRMLGFVADGDAPGTVLGRLVGEPDGRWERPAQKALQIRLGSYDPEPWRLLEQADEAAHETGRLGLETLFADAVPREIAEEVSVLRARAVADEGDYAQARTLLAGMADDAPSRLRDPAAALALRIRVELHAGGNADLARRLARELERDFPRSSARRDLAKQHPLLGMEEDPQAWIATLRLRIEQDGAGDLDLKTISRYARMLLLDHRAGAAEQFLSTLGPRGEAPELERLREAVRDAQADPSEAALSRNAQRVDAWNAKPGKATAEAVRDGGEASRGALLSFIARGDAARRGGAVHLLVDAVGEAAAVAGVRRLWSLDTRRIDDDLRALAAAVPYEPLRAARTPDAMDPETIAAVDAAWGRLTLGLSPDWLEGHPGYLQALRHDDYAVRRDALTQISTEDVKGVTPALVAHGLRDRAALMRREAVSLAGAADFRALARRGLEDRAWMVRQEAVRVVARLEGRGAVDTLRRLLRTDASREVRAAAAHGLVSTAPTDDRVLEALLLTQVGEEARLRDAIAARLSEQEPKPVVRAVARGWRRALERDTPHRGYLFRTALLYHRLTKEDLGFYPGATKDDLRKMLGRMEAWIARTPDAVALAPERAVGGGAPRRPTGRER